MFMNKLLRSKNINVKIVINKNIKWEITVFVDDQFKSDSFILDDRLSFSNCAAYILEHVNPTKAMKYYFCETNNYQRLKIVCLQELEKESSQYKSEAYEYLGRLMVTKKLNDRAEREFISSINNKRNMVYCDSYTELASLYVKMKRLDDAFDMLDKAKRGINELKDKESIKRKELTVKMLYAEICKQKGEYKKAIEILNELLDCKYEIDIISNIYFNIGWFYRLSGEYSKAIDAFRESLMYIYEVKDIVKKYNYIGDLY